jgi:hypothetical protein
MALILVTMNPYENVAARKWVDEMTRVYLFDRPQLSFISSRSAMFIVDACTADAIKNVTRSFISCPEESESHAV